MLLNTLINYIESYFRYDSNEAEIYWKDIPLNNKRAILNSPIGSIGTKGYRRVTILSKEFAVHRLIWYMHYKAWPNGFIDHINGNTLDNSISNLRESSYRANAQNQKRHREGNLVGANFRKDIGKWRSRVHINGKQHTIGNYDTEVQAHEAYILYCINNNLD